MCCHEINHLHAIIRYHLFDFDVCVVIFNVSYIESFYEKYSMFGKSKILCMSFSVIETYDPQECGGKQIGRKGGKSLKRSFQ